MGFKWLCPECDHENEYRGDKTNEANSTCSYCEKTQRIWKSRVIEVPTNSNKKPTNSNTFPTEYKSSMIHRPSKISVPIDHVNWLVVLEVMDRGISTIRNKPGVKAKKGSYYYDKFKWDAEFQKIEEIAKVMKLMGDEE